MSAAAAIARRYGLGAHEAHVVEGDFLARCGLCGGSLREIRVTGPRPRAIQEILLARDGTGAPPQLYHRGCWFNHFPTRNWDADVTIVCERLESPEVLDVCPACPYTLPKCASASSQSATDPWHTLGPAGRAVVTIDWPPTAAPMTAPKQREQQQQQQQRQQPPRVTVFHVECSDAHELPQLHWCAPPRIGASMATTGADPMDALPLYVPSQQAARAAPTLVAFRAFVRDGWFGSQASTRVCAFDIADATATTGSGAHAAAAAAAAAAAPVRVVLEEPLRGGGGGAAAVAPVPVCFARAPRRAPRVPWSFECYVAAATDAQSLAPHCTTAVLVSRRQHLAGVPLPARLPYHWPPTQGAYVSAVHCDSHGYNGSGGGSGSSGDDDIVCVCVRHRRPLPTTDQWLDYIEARITAAATGGAQPVHPFAAATQAALDATVRALPRAHAIPGVRILHGLDVYVGTPGPLAPGAPPRPAPSLVLLASGAAPATHADGTLAGWRLLPLGTPTE